MADLLLELCSEEIPARMQATGRAALADGVCSLLSGAGLAWDANSVRTYATPRRIAVVVEGIPSRQDDRAIERRGPRVDAPAGAQEGFRRGLEGTIHTIETQDDKKGAILVARIEEPGRPTTDLLQDGLPGLLLNFPWPKSMRWGDGEPDVRWVRPLQHIVCLFDGSVVPFQFGSVVSGSTTVGHRFLSPAAIELTDVTTYLPRLESAYVMADVAGRRARIEEQTHALADAEGLVVADDPRLLDEVTGLVEWPVSLLGTIDAGFMDVPEEVLTTTMRQHQKYLTLRTKEGRLAPRFIVVSNLEADDQGEAIRAGNERVLRARLWDARYFWTTDQAVALEERLPALGRMTFHADLGSIGERVGRLEKLAGDLAALVPGADPERARRAGRLAKADLVSGMVGEFPELQGVMGSYYARAQGEATEVAAAIADQYSPRGPNDRCPTAPDSIVLALAERADLLVGFFARNIKPTGSKDPFALRRAALGLIRLILENDFRLSLRHLFRSTHAHYSDRLDQGQIDRVVEDLLGFIAERLKVHLRTSGTRHDLIEAVFATNDDDDLVRLLQRVQALGAFLDGAEGQNLVAGVRRAANIVAIEEKRDRVVYDEAVDPALLKEESERELHGALEAVEVELVAAIECEEFGQAMTVLASLRSPVDRFFDAVLVNDPDPALRINRLRLLARIGGAFRHIANIASLAE